MTHNQQVIIIGMCVLGTMAMRFLPFLIFSSKRPTPKYIRYLGQVLAPASYAMIIVYCLRNVDLGQGTYGLPEMVAIAITVLLQLWKRQTVLSVATGTISYMILLQYLA